MKGTDTKVIILKAAPLLFIVYAAWILFQTLFDTQAEYAINVEPATAAARHTLAQYDNSRITSTGTMIIPDADLAIRLLWRPNNPYLLSFIDCLYTIFIALQVFLILRNVASSKTSVEKISTHVRSIGIGVVVFFPLNSIRKYIIEKQVLSFSHNEYELEEHFNSAAGIWLGVIFLALALAMKENANLKQEQELTI